MATLKVKIQEDIILGNQDYGSKRTLEISSIDEIYKRVVTCPASQTTTIAVFNSNAYGAAGAVDIEDSKYIRVTNLDGINDQSFTIGQFGNIRINQVSDSNGNIPQTAFTTKSNVPPPGDIQISGTARVSFAFYNTKQEIDYFVKSLKKAIAMLS